MAYPGTGQNHSHSIILAQSNALILRRKFSPSPTKNRLPGPSEIRALDFKRKFRRSPICSISVTIGIDWLIFQVHRPEQHCWLGCRKRPSAFSGLAVSSIPCSLDNAFVGPCAGAVTRKQNFLIPAIRRLWYGVSEHKVYGPRICISSPMKFSAP